MFEATLHAGRVKAAVQFVLAIAAKALNSRAASSRKREFDPSSAKYDFRIFLIHLGLNGDEFKTARTHLLSAMPGDAAFKRGRPNPILNPAKSGACGGGKMGALTGQGSRSSVAKASRQSDSPARPICSMPRWCRGWPSRWNNFVTILWVEDHPDLYVRGIFAGFEVEEAKADVWSTRSDIRR